MKLLAIFAAFVAAVNAIALLAIFDGPVTIGKTYDVEWLVDATETLELLLVHKTNDGWEQTKSLFKNKIGHAPHGNWSWHLDDTYPTGSGYALWLSSTPIPDNGGGYADLTDWFKILPA